MTFFRKTCSVFALLLFLVSFAALAEAAPIIPKGSRIVVMVGGDSLAGDVNIEQRNGYVRLAESVIRKELMKSNSYKVIDVAMNNKLKSEAIFGLESGSTKKILAAVKKYNVDYVLVGALSDIDAVLNDFQMYTSSNTVMLRVISSKTAEILFDDYVSGKSVGGTREEAIRKAIQKAGSVVAQVVMSGEME